MALVVDGLGVADVIFEEVGPPVTPPIAHAPIAHAPIAHALD